ncbi:MAG: hypothetical protein R3E87_24440 [Burkholderiaceae bacterium]
MTALQVCARDALTIIGAGDRCRNRQRPFMGRLVLTAFVAVLAGCGGGGHDNLAGPATTDSGTQAVASDSAGQGSANSTGAGATGDQNTATGGASSPEQEQTSASVGGNGGSPAAILYSSVGALDGLQGCMNRGLYESPTDVVMTALYDVESRSLGKGVWDLTSRWAAGTVSFMGTQARARTETVVTTGFVVQTTLTEEVTEFYQLNGWTVVTVGYFLDRNIPDEDPEETYFDLAVGESRLSVASSEGNDKSAVHTYLGRETISVPAGQFETCHVRMTWPADTSRGYSDRWIAVGSGVAVLDATSEGVRRELRQASINGQPVSP